MSRGFLLEYVIVGCLACVVGVAALNSTGSSVNGLIQKCASSLSTVGGGYVPPAPAESYDRIVENRPQVAAIERVSTFSIDVDTASYSNVRRFLTEGQLPPADAVRIEELVNYFPYRYPAPEGDEPLTVHAEVAACPWAHGNRLVRIGLTARQGDWAKRPRANLVFLVDVSGSMNEPRKLPLVKESLRTLLERLGEADRISIVTYAGDARIALPPTPADRKEDITAAIEGLGAGGGTNGAQGIVDAYRLARETYLLGGINRVVLATDGDFNLGVTSRAALVQLVRHEAKSGVELTILGYGMGNYRDNQLEEIASSGNGNYAYVDGAAEGRKVLSEQIAGTLWTIARDVKVQVEFDPESVQTWRQIGYENRQMAAKEFRDDAKDACEMGAGHTVTALYEVQPRRAGHLLSVRTRYKSLGAATAREVEFPLVDRGATFDHATPEFRFASAVASFGMILRDSTHRGTFTLADVARIAREHTTVDAHRAEFVELVEKAERLGAGRQRTASVY